MPFTYYLSFSSFFSDWQIHSHVVNFLRMYNPYIHDKGIKLFANKVLFLALLLTSIQLLKYNVFFFDLKVQQWSFHWHPAVDHTCGRARSEPDRGGHCYFCGTWLESHEGSTGIYTFHKLFPFGVTLNCWFAIVILGLGINVHWKKHSCFCSTQPKLLNFFPNCGLDLNFCEFQCFSNFDILEYVHGNLCSYQLSSSLAKCLVRLLSQSKWTGHLASMINCEYMC